MAFRIRNCDGDYPEAQAAEEQYREHLAQFPKTSNRDLWKYFYWDFFHDGAIASIKISPDFRTVEMAVSCTNIKSIKRLHGEDFDCLTAHFTVMFRGVSYLHLESESDPNADGQPGHWHDAPLCFRYAEINTRFIGTTNRSSGFNSEAQFSLLIEYFGSRTVWLELVFEQVDVLPDESLAFSLMESDPKFSVPTYDPAQ